MVVQLSPRVEAEIERLVASGQYANADEVIDEGLRLLAERERARFLQLRDLVREGFESGDALELTPELMDEIEREAEEAAKRGEIPSPHVCP
jgi:putative addiction module CopG family antidote